MPPFVLSVLQGTSVKKWWDIMSKYTDNDGKEVSKEVCCAVMAIITITFSV